MFTGQHLQCTTHGNYQKNQNMLMQNNSSWTENWTCSIRNINNQQILETGYQCEIRNRLTSACRVWEMTCSGISGNLFFRASNICPLWPFLSAAIKYFASTMYKAFCVPFSNVSFVLYKVMKRVKLTKEVYLQTNFHTASVNVRFNTYCA